MQLPSRKELKDFERWHKTPPSLKSHGLEDSPEHPLSEQLLEAHPRNWKLQGNELLCDTDFGPLRQRIPTDYIMKGLDKAGLPNLVKVIL